eukprot:m.233815 g.233815  ORF g.233815 m.233815 type:complete len:61 (-) comp10883_c0_seq1:1419-1601(-)
METVAPGAEESAVEGRPGAASCDCDRFHNAIPDHDSADATHVFNEHQATAAAAAKHRMLP